MSTWAANSGSSEISTVKAEGKPLCSEPPLGSRAGNSATRSGVTCRWKSITTQAGSAAWPWKPIRWQVWGEATSGGSVPSSATTAARRMSRSAASAERQESRQEKTATSFRIEGTSSLSHTSPKRT